MDFEAVGRQLLQVVFSGISMGCIYALIGIGLTIVINAARIINVAQGEFVMRGLGALPRLSLQSSDIAIV